MAITMNNYQTRCQVRLQDGVDDLGNPIYVNRMLARIKPDTSNQDLYDIVHSVFSLQSLPVKVIKRIDEGQLSEEE